MNTHTKKVRKDFRLDPVLVKNLETIRSYLSKRDGKEITLTKVVEMLLNSSIKTIQSKRQ